MLRVLQPRQATLSPMRGLLGKLRRWWMAMTNEEQRDVLVRGATVAVCAVAATVTLPVIGQVQSDIRAQADFRESAQRLAAIEDGGTTARTEVNAPDVLDSPWLRTVEYTLERDTDSSMSRYAKRDRDGAALASLVSFRPEHLKRAESLDAETHCMAQAVYYESGNEPVAGQLAVAEVVSNRMRDHRYPDTACDVVFQGSTRTTGCQFTFTCDGAMKTPPMGSNWDRAKRIAAHVLMNLGEDNTGGATHYHAIYVDPVWSAGLIKTDRIGLHVFYRFPRGAEWASVQRDYGRRSSAPIVTPAADARDLDAAAQSMLVQASAPAPKSTGIAATAAPATVTTTTRTITNGAPRMTTAREVSYKVASNDAVSMDAYTAAQAAKATAAAGSAMR
ncbi:MAG: cell wall hydrolase [Hyphomonas sp.]|nr:cell wall hydrolase [Hyphomonas sp.]MCB9972834.1 cell wall hydrolase [Hyphomonas sp.]